MMADMDAELTVRHLCAVGALLGESPLWIDDALWFVDIKRARIHRFVPGGALEAWQAPAQVGWVQPVADGTMLAGLQGGIHRFDSVTGRFDLIVRVEADRPGNRLNDACVDPAGRLWFGTMDDAETAPSGRIYRADQAGVTAVIGGVAIPNGPAVSPDGRTLYYCDTLRGTVYACLLDQNGAIVGRRVFLRVDPDRQGHPDGPIVDAEGYLWLGFHGGWRVRRYDPDGRRVAEVRLPVANVTKIAIGGPDGRTAYVTTAANGLSSEQRAEQPAAGDLFAFDAGVAGQPTHAVAVPLATWRD